MTILQRLLAVVKNKYVIATAAFIIWMFFFDPKDWGLIAGRAHKLRELKESEQHLTQQITDTKKELSQLKDNAQTIEKYAREKFYMKKDNEDLFIVKDQAKE